MGAVFLGIVHVWRVRLTLVRPVIFEPSVGTSSGHLLVKGYMLGPSPWQLPGHVSEEMSAHGKV